MKFWIKTLGWAMISGGIYFVAGLLAGSPVSAAGLATLVCVVTKTPFYAAYEWSFSKLYPSKADPVFDVELVPLGD